MQGGGQAVQGLLPPSCVAPVTGEPAKSRGEPGVPVCLPFVLS